MRHETQRIPQGRGQRGRATSLPAICRARSSGPTPRATGSTSGSSGWATRARSTCPRSSRTTTSRWWPSATSTRRATATWTPSSSSAASPGQDTVNAHYAEKTKSGQYRGCQAYTDFRELLARDDIDAVVVVVPDHWHALMTVAAAKAGKDIYCEKPLSLTVEQGRAMVKAVQQYNRILQTGSQHRSGPSARQRGIMVSGTPLVGDTARTRLDGIILVKMYLALSVCVFGRGVLSKLSCFRQRMMRWMAPLPRHRSAKRVSGTTRTRGATHERD